MSDFKILKEVAFIENLQKIYRKPFESLSEDEKRKVLIYKQIKEQQVKKNLLIKSDPDYVYRGFKQEIQDELKNINEKKAELWLELGKIGELENEKTKPENEQSRKPNVQIST